MLKRCKIFLLFQFIFIGGFCFCEFVDAADAENQYCSVICIAPLSNNTGDKQYDALAEGFADILAATLSEQKTVKVVERQRLNNLLVEQNLSLLGLTDSATAVKVGKLLKADHIFVGGIAKPEKIFIINVHAYEIETARLVASEQVQGKPEEIVPATYDLVNKLCEKLNLPLKPIDPNDIDKNPNASIHFIRGLGFYYSGNFDNAIVEFIKTQDLDPASDKAGYWMALCFMETGEYKHALIELEGLLARFPESPLRQDTQEKMNVCKKHIKPERHER
jgi:TolB-like protein